ncbi:MAG TPA: alpha-amylase family glycosyl hydrolase [Trebonia sp.]|nr:alpha-amylase family glycosyl hydrolase [Trebonia sp.]
MIYEVNTAVWLAELSRAAGTPVTLGAVSHADWDAVTPAGVDAVWLMGVWERSPAGLDLALANEDLLQSFRDALPDLRDADIIGSPYCVHRYAADERFGGPAGLAAARAALAERGVRLILDYVPNHVAPDHPWVTEHPEYFIQGDDDDLREHPGDWLSVGVYVLAHGRDPYFPPWPDVVQLNAYAAAARGATEETLIDIAGQCDGIRCDMAMLMTNDIFGKTWGDRAGPRPEAEFWPAVIAALRASRPDTVLIAEAYWDMEWTLQQQGFAFCYDKRLYDRILELNPPDLRGHLQADLGYQSRLVRFLENHDEPRIAGTLPAELERAAAVTIATLPGATLWHEGQFEGRRVRPPVFLARRPDEPLDRELAAWYRELLDEVAERRVRTGAWQLLEADGWPDNQSCRNLIAWSWTPGADAGGVRRHVIVVNLSENEAQARIRLPWPDLPGRRWRLLDPLSGNDFTRDGGELADPGLYVDLKPGQYYLLAVR